jgi:hypothetical protein
VKKVFKRYSKYFHNPLFNRISQKVKKNNTKRGSWMDCWKMFMAIH